MTPQFRPKVMRERRESLNLSRLDVVKRLYEQKFNISEETIRMWEEGTTAPDADRLPVLATVLQCSIGTFYE